MELGGLLLATSGFAGAPGKAGCPVPSCRHSDRPDQPLKILETLLWSCRPENLQLSIHSAAEALWLLLDPVGFLALAAHFPRPFFVHPPIGCEWGASRYPFCPSLSDISSSWRPTVRPSGSAEPPRCANSYRRHPRRVPKRFAITESGWKRWYIPPRSS